MTIFFKIILYINFFFNWIGVEIDSQKINEHINKVYKNN